MIYDKIENLPLYNGLNQNIKKMNEYLARVNLEKVTPGKYNIDGDNLMVIVQEFETAPEDGRMFEAHEKYIDIQYVISGQERMKYAYRTGDETILKLYPSEEDITMYSAKTIDQEVIVSAGYFVMFDTHDLHMPCLQVLDWPGKVKKLVFKLKK